MGNQLKNMFKLFFGKLNFSMVMLFIFASFGYGQSDFYKTESRGQQFKQYDNPERFTYIIGNHENEIELKSTKFKSVAVQFSDAEKNISRTTLSEILNSNPKVKHLYLNQLAKDFNLLALDLEKLKYIEQLHVRVTNDFDLDYLWSKLNKIGPLTNLKIEGTKKVNLYFSNEFEKLISKLNGLCVSDIAVEIDSSKSIEHSIKTLILMNVVDSGFSSKNALDYFSSNQIEEFILNNRGEFKWEWREYFQSYSNLKHLEFMYYKAESNINVVSYFSPELETLDFKCLWNDFPTKGLGKLKKLRRLNVTMKGNRKSIDFEDLVGLERLESLSCAVDSVGNFLGELKNLTQLHLAGKYTTLPSSISNLKNLEEVSLFSENLKSIPSSFGNFDKLEKLTIRADNLTSIPEEIGSIINLKELTIDGDLNILPESIGGLKKLVTLNLKGNQLQSLPKTIGNLKNLETILLGGNSHNVEKVKGEYRFDQSCFDVDGLPAKIFRINTLKTIDISNTKVSDGQLKYILDLAMKYRCDQLSLILSSCGITKLPEGKYENLHLDVLDLSNNLISEFPKSFYFSKIISIKLNENKGFLPVSEDRKTSLIFGYLYGTLEKSDLSISDSIPWAVAKYRSEVKVPVFDLAYSLDPETTSKLIEERFQADYFFFNGNFEKSNELYESSKSSYNNKKEDVTYITDYKISNHWIRYLIGLKEINNRDVLLENLIEIENQIDSLAKKTSENEGYKLFYATKVYLGLFYKDLDNKKSRFFANQAARILSDQKDANALNFLELCLVSGLNEIFDSYYLDVITRLSMDEHEEVILEYLKVVRDIVGNQEGANIIGVEKMLSEPEVHLLRWDTSLVEIWSNYLPKDKAEKIKALNKIINPRLEYYPVPLD